MDYRFSVLIPVYYKEKPEYFSQALASVIDQTLMPDEIVVVKDGPLTEELEDVLSGVIKDYPGLFKIISLKENKGLGNALSAGVNKCSYELIARMDSDDICRSDRFEKQINEFKLDSDLDICGSQIAEFEMSVEKPAYVRKVPVTDSEIKKRQGYRSAFNHMSVMFKKATIITAGNYQDFPYMEDHILWSIVLKNDVKVKNIDMTLVYVRVGDDMFRRRGGIEYFKYYQKGRNYLFGVKNISLLEYLLSCVVHFFVALLPNKLRIIFYQQVLRQKRA